MNNRTPIPNNIRFLVFKRDGFRCRYCGRTSEEAQLEVDHIVPISKGGEDEIGNMITACKECNRGKRASEVLPTDDRPTKNEMYVPSLRPPGCRGSGDPAIYCREEAYPAADSVKYIS